MPHSFLRTAAFLLLSACSGGFVLPGAGVHQISLLDHTLTVAAPRGYCIDPKASVTRGDQIVVLIGRCSFGGNVAAALVALTVGAPASAGVLTVGPEKLARFFTSVPGRKVLARDGIAGHVEVTQALFDQTSLYLHLKDAKAGEYWRAITGVQGRVVSISASGAEGAPLTADQAYHLVRETVALLAARNPDMAPPASKS